VEALCVYFDENDDGMRHAPTALANDAALAPFYLTFLVSRPHTNHSRPRSRTHGNALSNNPPASVYVAIYLSSGGSASAGAPKLRGKILRTVRCKCARAA